MQNYGVSLPTKKEIQGIKYNFFFESIEQLISQKENGFTTSPGQGAIQQIWSWLKADKDSAPVSLILFDLDHTLVFSQAYYNKIRETGPNVLAYLTGLKINDIKIRLKQLEENLSRIGYPLRQHDIAKEFGLSWSELDQATVSKVKAKDYIKEDKELKNLLIGLRSLGLQIAVLTDSAKCKAMDILSALGNIENYFDAVFTADELGVVKPDPAFFRRALDYFGAIPKETIVIGDSRTLDLIPAETLGMRTVLIRSRDNLLKLHGSIFSKTETARRLQNFITDIQGFQQTYFGNQNRSRASDWDLVLRAFQRVFKTFWKGIQLDEKDLLDIYQTLYDEFGETELNKNGYDKTIFDRVNSLVRFSNRILEIARIYDNAKCKVYLGLDGLFWQAADQHNSKLYCLDGFALSTIEELKAIQPFYNNLLPEHHSIVYRIMQKLIQQANLKSKLHGNLETELFTLFSEELVTGRNQRELLHELYQTHDSIKNDEIVKGISAKDRKSYFKVLINLLKERNVFALKVQKIGKDFAQFLDDSIVGNLDIEIVDRAIRGTQPFFLKCAVCTVEPKWKNRVNLCLLVDPENDGYDGLEFKMLTREKIPLILEELRPISKSRVERLKPLKPVYQIQKSHIVDGFFSLILLNSGERKNELIEVVNRTINQPENDFIEELSKILHTALKEEIEKICNVISDDKTDSELIEVCPMGSTSRNTWVSLDSKNGCPLADFDFEILIPSSRQFLVEEILANLDQYPGSLVGQIRDHGHRLTRMGFQWYTSRVEGKIIYLINANGYEFGVDVLVKIRTGFTYNELLSLQLEKIKLLFGDEGVKQLKKEIRRLKELFQAKSIYRDRVRQNGISGVGVEQLVIQSGRVGTDPFNIERIGTVDSVFEWVRKVAENSTKPLQWNKARFKLFVIRITSSDNRIGSYLDRLTEDQWKLMVNIAFEHLK